MRLLPVLALLLTRAAAADTLTYPTLSDRETKRLEAGEVLVREFKPTGNRGIGVESMSVVDAPSDEVFRVLRDCAQFSKFMPRTKESLVTEEDGRHVCHVVLEMPFPLANLWSDTTAEEHEEPAGHFHRSWTGLRGTYNHNTGSWAALPWGAAGRQTLVVYVLDTDPKILIPDALLRSAQTGSLPEVFAGIRKRVVALRQ
jgi:carbon monoxide dehydrogenase subunit G